MRWHRGGWQVNWFEVARCNKTTNGQRCRPTIVFRNVLIPGLYSLGSMASSVLCGLPMRCQAAKYVSQMRYERGRSIVKCIFAIHNRCCEGIYATLQAVVYL